MIRSLKSKFAYTFVILAFCMVAAPLGAQSRTAEPFAWRGTIAPGAALEIKGVNGSIEAVAANGSGAVVEATRTARRSDPSEVEIAVVEHAGGVTICAIYPSSSGQNNECRPGNEGSLNARTSDVQVTFTVQVPTSVNFTGHTVNGRVSAEDLSGEVVALSTNGDLLVHGGSAVNARTTNGSVSLRSSGFASARTINGSITAEIGTLAGSSDPLSFTTTNGSITLRLPANANATIDASSRNGGIQTNLPVTVQGEMGRSRLQGTIGSGGREIEVRTTNGRIRLEQGS